MGIRGTVTIALACALALTTAPSASALPDCTIAPPRERVVASGQGTLESAIVDRRGHLYFTSSAAGGSLLKLRNAKAAPRPLVTGLEAPGGLAFHRSGDLLLGFGSSILGGATGTLDPRAGLVRVNPRTGVTRPYAERLAMANGVARAADGTVFASDDFGIGIDRIGPDRSVENAWATVVSSNGMAVGPGQRWLYVNQTFVPAAIQRVRIDDPTVVEDYFRPGLEDVAAGLDGMARDRHGNLYVTANLYGELWRVGRDGSACVVADGLGMASAVALGRSKRNLRRGHLYVVEFGGRVIELRGGLRTRP